MTLAQRVRSLAARTGEDPEALLRELAMERVLCALQRERSTRGCVLRGGLWLRARHYAEAWSPRDVDLVCAPGQELRELARAMDAALPEATVLEERVLHGDTTDPGLRRTIAFAMEKDCAAVIDVDLALGYPTLAPVALAWPGRLDGRLVFTQGIAPAVVAVEQLHRLAERGPAVAERVFRVLDALARRELLESAKLTFALRSAMRFWRTSAMAMTRAVHENEWPEALHGLRLRVLGSLSSVS